MKKNSVIEIRQTFLDFFSLKDHKVVSSSSLLPEEDSSLLFTNSGMNQFKNIFLGLDRPLSRRVTTVQRCVRAGGKHNDLENVGYTDRHLTFFEMMGNFSFGDYFKEDAIFFAWELLTSSHWFGLSKNKLFVTVYKDDKISYDIWRNKIGMNHDRIICVGDKNTNDVCLSENFWQMGDFGPCGPCSEIFYDYDGGYEKKKTECEQKSISQIDNKNYLEIWNLVFMEFNRQRDGTLLPLPMLSVDTGMGLERISSVLQHVDSSYDIDLFYHLMRCITDVIGFFDFKNRSFRVIIDHIRTCSFLIVDGVLPSNEGHGYVLRRIIRRAVRHGKVLGVHGVFFYKLVQPLITVMGYLYSTLIKYKNNIEQILFAEEKKFSVALEHGLDVLNKELSTICVGDVLKGDKAFDLYSTYGFPLRFTKNICLKRKVKVDEIGFNRAMLIHKKLAQKSKKFVVNKNKLLLMNCATDFVGYEILVCSSRVVSLFKDNHSSQSLLKDELGIVILDKTPFYGESGGQVGDCGELRTEFFYFEVLKTWKYGQVFAHWGKVITGILKVGDYVVAQVNSEYRKSVSLHHSATHLLSAALSIVLGSHVIQQGSLISNQYLRFDFSHDTSMSFNQIALVEDIINQKIQSNMLIESCFLPLDQAINRGAKTLFGKKYSEVVRVLNINDFSLELCGGTHAIRTGDIGLFIIVSESSIASGIRRIEAKCGTESVLFFHKQRRLIQNIECCIKNNGGNTVLKSVEMLCSRLKTLEKELKVYKNRQIIEESERLMKKMRYVDNIKLIISQIYNVNLKILRAVVSNVKAKLASGVVIVFFIDNVNVLYLVVGTTQDIIRFVNAVDIINYLKYYIGGNGGGNPYLAQSSGGNITLLLNIVETMLLDTFLIKKIESCIER